MLAAGAGRRARAARRGWPTTRGRRRRSKGNWDLAVARLTRAVQKDPDNIGYKIALENARMQASRMHYDLGAQAPAGRRTWRRRRRSWRSPPSTTPATSPPPTSWRWCGARIRHAGRGGGGAWRTSTTMRARAGGPAGRVPVLSPRSHGPHHPQLPGPEPAEACWRRWASWPGVNVLFDEGFRDKNVTVNLRRRDLPGGPGPDHLREPPLLQGPRPEHDHHRARVAGQAAQLRRRCCCRPSTSQNAEIKDVETIVKTAVGTTAARGLQPDPGRHQRHRHRGPDRGGVAARWT